MLADHGNRDLHRDRVVDRQRRTGVAKIARVMSGPPLGSGWPLRLKLRRQGRPRQAVALRPRNVSVSALGQMYRWPSPPG